MIASLTGTLRSKNPTDILIEVQNIGYSVSIPLSTYEKLGDVGSTATVLTHMHVREDAVQLFGFFSEEERRLFRLLISVSGIGPRIAQGILSGIRTDELKQHLQSGNTNALTTIPGVGKKTAERLVVELRDKVIKSFGEDELTAGTVKSGESIRIQALQALISLGYNQQTAEKAIRLVSKEAEIVTFSLEELIKRALRYTASGKS
jgi:Holliday junction DNA helicase RuvA